MNKRIEIVRVDPQRWAWLHLPLGAALGIAFVVWYFIQESGVDIEMFVEGAICIVVGIPCIIAVVMAVAWTQASLLNGLFLLLGKGPVLSIRTVDDVSEEMNETVEQRTERYLATLSRHKDTDNL